MSNLNFKQVTSDRLFYDQYKYCIKTFVPEVSVFRYAKTHEHIDRELARRIEWRSRAATRWAHSQCNVGIDEHTAERLHNLHDFMQTISAPYKMILSVDTVWFYSNDLNFIQSVHALPYTRTRLISQAVVNRPANTIVLRNPIHKHRSYFRYSKLSDQSKTQLLNFLTSQEDVRLSPGLKQWAKKPYYRTEDYFFVDHNGGGWDLMINLIQPNLIRRTLDIIAK